MKPAANQEMLAAYAHVDAFFNGFVQMLSDMFENDDVPTDAGIVVELFAELIDTPKGQRPFPPSRASTSASKRSTTRLTPSARPASRP